MAETQQAVRETGHEVLRDRTAAVLEGLKDCRGRLLDAEREGETGRDGRGGQEAWAEMVRRLPPLAFEVARRTKELAQRVDGVEGDDEFR